MFRPCIREIHDIVPRTKDCIPDVGQARGPGASCRSHGGHDAPVPGEGHRGGGIAEISRDQAVSALECKPDKRSRCRRTDDSVVGRRGDVRSVGTREVTTAESTVEEIDDVRGSVKGIGASRSPREDIGSATAAHRGGTSAVGPISLGEGVGTGTASQDIMATAANKRVIPTGKGNTEDVICRTTHDRVEAQGIRKVHHVVPGRPVERKIGQVSPCHCIPAETVSTGKAA